MNRKDLTKTFMVISNGLNHIKKFYILRVEASKDQIVSVLSLVISKGKNPFGCDVFSFKFIQRFKG